jgi:hypothetical protein
MFNKLLDPEGSKLPRLAQLGPQMEEETRRLAGLSLEQLAGEVLTKAFTAEDDPQRGMHDQESIAGSFVPQHGPERYGDTMPAEFYPLLDLVAEGTQRLETEGLIRSKFEYQGQMALFGWVTTRAGRAAIGRGGTPG